MNGSSSMNSMNSAVTSMRERMSAFVSGIKFERIRLNRFFVRMAGERSLLGIPKRMLNVATLIASKS